MSDFVFSLKTVIETDRSSRPVEHAVKILKRDMRETLTAEGPENSIRLVLDSGLEEEHYTAEVTEDGILLRYADDLGAVYALLSVSEKCLGILPLGWWNGIRPEKTERRLIPEQRWQSPEYAVRYRCWFINDEILLDGWKDTMADRREVWRRIFETLLRCGGNMTIPGTDRAQDGDDLRDLATDMGLWLTQEHTQVLGARMFSRVYPDLTPSYRQYPDLYEELWREAAKKYAGRHVVWSVGFRGQGDRHFWADDPEFDTDEKRGAFISKTILRQIELVREQQPDAVFSTNLYGEMMDLYKKGYLKFPEGVIRVWGDNGYGTMVSRRQNLNNPRVCSLPEKGSEDPQGIYYHIAFYDLQAANHLTMLQIPPRFVAEELKKNLEHGADTIWNINVGSFKPHLFMAALVSSMWQDGACDTDRLAEEYALCYFGSEKAGKLMTEYAQSAVRYGENPDDLAGDQFYYFPLRSLICAVAGNEHSQVASLNWVCMADTLRGQAEKLAKTVEPGILSWKKYERLCRDTMEELPEERRKNLSDTMLLQAILHQSGSEALFDMCQAVMHSENRNELQAFLWTNASLCAAERGLAALREAEHGDFTHMYRNDCFTNVALAVRMLENLRGYFRLRGDGDMQYNWEKQYTVPAEEKLVVLQTHRWNQLTDDELAKALDGIVPLEKL